MKTGMNYIFHYRSFKERRKILRHRMTPQESILWNYLRKNNLGVKFRRQISIGPYIVDFYCGKYKLVIEINGPYHNYQALYDMGRTKFLSSLNLKVLIYMNEEIENNIEHVIEDIKKIIGK